MQFVVLSAHCPFCQHPISIGANVSGLPAIEITKAMAKGMNRIGDDLAEDLDALATFQAAEREWGKIAAKIGGQKTKGSR